MKVCVELGIPVSFLFINVISEKKLRGEGVRHHGEDAALMPAYCSDVPGSESWLHILAQLPANSTFQEAAGYRSSKCVPDTTVGCLV